jgi:hypothetical protein
MAVEIVPEQIAREYLRDIQPMWKAFWFHMHSVARNLEQFAVGLARISDEIYAYHASGQKNDLADWVQEVVGDAILARHLRSAKDRHDAADIVRVRVDELKRSIGR